MPGRVGLPARLLYIGRSNPALHEGPMTTVDVVFKYGLPPGENEARAIADAREVYGIRKLTLDEKQRTVRVEYDASRLNEDTVANLLRNAGLDLEEKVVLAS